MKNTVLALGLAAVFAIFLTSTPVGAAPHALVVSISPAFPKVMKGSVFNVGVYVTSIPMQGIHCAKFELHATGGFTVLTKPKTVQHITANDWFYTVVFKVRAPQTKKTGTFSAAVTWSQVYSCGGTVTTTHALNQTVLAKNPWKFNLEVGLPPCISGADNDVTYTLSDREHIVGGLPMQRFRTFVTVDSPYAVTINVHPSRWLFDARMGFPCLIGDDIQYFYYPKSGEITGNRQTLSWP